MNADQKGKFDQPLGMLPDGRLNVVKKGAPRYEPEVEDDPEDDTREVTDAEIEAQLRDLDSL